MLSNHFHHVHSSHRLKTEFSQVFAFRTVRALAASLISIFVPIYLYQQSENILVSLTLISSYFSLVFIFRALITVPVANLVARIGGKHVLAISTVFDAFAFLSLAYIGEAAWLIIPVGLLQGLASTTFFTALHLELSHSIGEKKTHGVGTVEIARKITMALGPLIGGVIAGYFGFIYLTYAATACVLASLFFIHLSSEPLRSTKKVDPKKVREYLTHNKSCKANYGMALNTGAAMLIWPLFIYVFLDSYESVGYVVSLSLVVALIIMITVRKNEASSSIDKELAIGGRGSSLVHLSRGLAVNPFLITLVNIANDIFIAVFHVPYIAQYYKNASKADRGAYIAAMEISYSIGIVSIWPIILAAYSFTNNIRMALTAAFIAAAVGVLYNRNIQKNEQ